MNNPKTPSSQTIRSNDRQASGLKGFEKIGFIGIAFALCGIAVTGCDRSDQIITLKQPANTVILKRLDLNPKGTIGDLTGFEAPVHKDGKEFGHVMGMMSRVGDLKAGTRPDREESMLTAVFDLPDGQISVLGISYYKQGENILQIGIPMTRAIVGGTGHYVGVDGEVTTTHNADSSYTHVLKIIR